MNDKDRNTVLLVLGAVLIFVGLWWLLGGLFGPIFAPLGSLFRFLRSIAWPLVIIAGGILFIVMSQGVHIGADVRGKRLYRSRSDRMIAGVIGGFAEYIEADSTWLRVGYALITVVLGFGPGILLYVLAIFIVPEEPPSAQDLPAPPPSRSGAEPGAARDGRAPAPPSTPASPPVSQSDAWPAIPPPPAPTQEPPSAPPPEPGPQP